MVHKHRILPIQRIVKKNIPHMQHGSFNNLSKKYAVYEPLKARLTSQRLYNSAAFGENHLTKNLILCDCLGSQSIDVDAISKATGLACSRVHNNLCGDEINLAAKGIAEGEALIACQQERQRFEELA
ncbi:MAG: hypothetical protein P8P24_05765, partial [Planktomarina sp.]|nr:hypothetical protein [Planktomarina sp.]